MEKWHDHQARGGITEGINDVRPHPQHNPTHRAPVCNRCPAKLVCLEVWPASLSGRASLMTAQRRWDVGPVVEQCAIAAEEAVIGHSRRRGRALTAVIRALRFGGRGAEQAAWGVRVRVPAVYLDVRPAVPSRQV